jgi:hypothetical protein
VEKSKSYLESLEPILLVLDGTRLITHSLESVSSPLVVVHRCYIGDLPMCKGDSGGLELLLDRLLEPFLGGGVDGLEVDPELLGSGALEVKIEKSVFFTRLDKALHLSLILVKELVKGDSTESSSANFFVLSRACRAARG